MKWQQDSDKMSKLERLYRQLILVALSAVLVVLIVAFVYPKDQRREPVKSAVLFMVCIGYILPVIFLFRAKIKKSGIIGSELYSYWLSKPLSKCVYLTILILIIVDIYRLFKGKH
jgi:hypothetical protein